MTDGQRNGVVLTSAWQLVSPGLEARLLSTGDQRVDPDGRPIEPRYGLLSEEAQRTQRFVWGALVEFRDTSDQQREDQRMSDSPTPGVPGYEGSVGPFPDQYGKPHVYARNVHSGAGNCVCGSDLGDRRHTEAAPGVPVPDWARH